MLQRWLSTHASTKSGQQLSAKPTSSQILDLSQTLTRREPSKTLSLTTQWESNTEKDPLPLAFKLMLNFLMRHHGQLRKIYTLTSLEPNTGIGTTRTSHSTNHHFSIHMGAWRRRSLFMIYKMLMLPRTGRRELDRQKCSQELLGQNIWVVKVSRSEN